MTIKDCGNHESKRCKYFRRALIGFVIFTFIVLLIAIIIIFVVLRPTNPEFTLQDATVYSFNLSTPNILTSVFQVTIRSKNPNDQAGVYYDKLISYAVYRDEQITLATGIPPTYQDPNGINVWSPFIYGNNVPVAPYIGNQLNSELSMGNVMLCVKMDGRIRRKVGAWVSGQYRLHVNCDAIIPFGNPNSGIAVGHNAIKYQLIQNCRVSV